MRTVLLAASRTTPQGTLRADLLIGGRSVLAWQAGLARAWGCERIILLTERASTAAAEAESACRARGIAFHRLARFADLAALLHAEDELMLLADGLLPDALDQQTKEVLCLPADDPQAIAFPQDFERIDATRCWAGVALIRAAPVHTLGDFPPDSDAVSLLLRMALQAGTPCRILSPQERTPARLLLARDESVVNDHEQALIAQQRGQSVPFAPALMLADYCCQRIGVRSVQAGPQWAAVAGLVLLLGALGGAATGWVVPALIAAMLGSFALDLVPVLTRLKAALEPGEPGAGQGQELARLHDPGRDGLVSLLLMTVLADWPLAALGLLAVGAARLAARAAPPAAAAFWHDRTAHIALLLAAAGLGWFAEACALLALGAVAQALATHRAQAIPE